MKALIRYTLNEGDNVEHFLQQWRVYLDKVLLSGFNLDANQQGTLLLMALLDTWRSFISTQSATAALSITNLYARILQENSMRMSASTSIGPTTTQVALGNFSYKGKFKGKKTFNNPPNRLNKRVGQPIGVIMSMIAVLKGEH